MRHAKVDRDHADLIATARKLGWSVASTAAVSNGFPDAAMTCRRTCPTCGHQPVLLVEFKTGKTGRLTAAQKRFHATWKGPVAIIRTVDDLLALLAPTRA